MRNDYLTYISLVRAALWGERTIWPEKKTEQLLRLNACQHTEGIVYPFVLTHSTLSSYARVYMQSAYARNAQRQVALQRTLVIAWRALEQAGIHAVLMKGVGLAIYYQEQQRREWGDIDLYVGPEQYHFACTVMRETFSNAIKFDEELDHYKHYNLIIDGVSVEVHRITVNMFHPIDKYLYAKIERYGMTNNRELEVNDLIVRVPEPTYNALLVFLHSWEHMLNAGANIRQFCDLALLLKNTSIEIKPILLKRWLISLNLLNVWQLYMYILVQYIGLSANDTYFYTAHVADRANLLLEDLLSGKMVAPKVAHEIPKRRVARKIYTMRERFENARRIKKYSPSYARHMVVTTLLNGACRLFAKDRHWE